MEISIDKDTGAPTNSPLDIIVVGGGLGGLTAAIECRRFGHSVTLFDAVPQVPLEGDGIGIGSNAFRIMAQWGDGVVHQRLLAHASDATHIEILDAKNRHLGYHRLRGYGPGEGCMMTRGRLVSILTDHAQELGVSFRRGLRVVRYKETESLAQVSLEGGETFTADCVVCADGVHSHARSIIVGLEPVRSETGWATYRAHVQTKKMTPSQKRDAQWLLEEAHDRDLMKAWFGDGVQLTIWTVERGQGIIWVLTHQDLTPSQDGWTNSPGAGQIEDALDCLHDWPTTTKDKVYPIIRATAAGKLHNQKVVVSAPLPRWVSSGGRLILVGDAAHPLPPIAGQGGGQAVEDGAVLGVALEKASSQDVPLALRAMEFIRLPRATEMQLSSGQLHEILFKPDWDAVAQDPGILAPPFPDWIFGHNSQLHTREQLPLVLEALQNNLGTTSFDI